MPGEQSASLRSGSNLMLRRGASACCMATLVLITVTIPGQEKPLATSAPAYGLAERQLPPPSQGLLNDCLRTQSETFGDWDLGGQVRVRYEIKENGGIYPNFDFRRAGVDNDNAYLLLREKLHLGYAPCSWFGLFAEGRDNSAIGDERHPSPDADQVDLYQAFIRVGDPKQFPLTAKIGRQELIYGDERLVGNADWNNVPRSFDAAKLRFENPNLWVDAFAGLVVVPVPHQFNEDNNHDWFSGIYASSSTLVPWQETQLYFLSRNASTKAVGAVSGSLYPLPSARDIETAGARVKSLPGQWNGWDYTAELAGQFGSINVAVPGAGRRRVDQEALAAAVTGGYTWATAPFTPRLGLEYDFASGDHDPRDGQSGTFENLFPTNHKVYGYMDFFSWRNMHDLRLTASLRPAKPLLVTLDYHVFWLADTHDYFYPIAGAGRSASSSYGRNRSSTVSLGRSWTSKPSIPLRPGSRCAPVTVIFLSVITFKARWRALAVPATPIGSTFKPPSPFNATNVTNAPTVLDLRLGVFWGVGIWDLGLGISLHLGV